MLVRILFVLAILVPGLHAQAQTRIETWDDGCGLNGWRTFDSNAVGVAYPGR